MTLKFLHVLSTALFAGAALTMLALQGYLARSQELGEQRALARAGAAAGKWVVMPVMYLAFLTGVAHWALGFDFRGPPYIHVMLTVGLVAVGAAQMWKRSARKLAEALGRGEDWSDAKAHLEAGTRHAFLTLGLLVITYGVAVFKIPAGRG